MSENKPKRGYQDGNNNNNHNHNNNNNNKQNYRQYNKGPVEPIYYDLEVNSQRNPNSVFVKAQVVHIEEQEPKFPTNSDAKTLIVTLAQILQDKKSSQKAQIKVHPPNPVFSKDFEEIQKGKHYQFFLEKKKELEQNQLILIEILNGKLKREKESKQKQNEDQNESNKKAEEQNRQNQNEEHKENERNNNANGEGEQVQSEDQKKNESENSKGKGKVNQPKKYQVIQLKEWTQVRNCEKFFENSEKKISQIKKIREITANDKFVNILGFVTECQPLGVVNKASPLSTQEFQKNETQDQPSAHKLTLRDQTGEIHCILPNIEKFKSFALKDKYLFFQKGQIKFSEINEGEKNIYLNIYINEKQKKLKSLIWDVSKIPEFQGDIDEISKAGTQVNVSRKVWVVKAAQTAQ